MASIPSLKGAIISVIFYSFSFVLIFSSWLFGPGYPLPPSHHTFSPTILILPPSPSAFPLLPLPLPFLHKSEHRLCTIEHTTALLVATSPHTCHTSGEDRNPVL